MITLNPVAVSSEPLLRAIHAGGFANQSELALRAGRDPKNMTRDIGIVRKANLVAGDALTLTADGLAQLAALDRATGDGPFADGRNLSLHHSLILPDPKNARKDWTSPDAVADLEALAASIRDRGLLQPPNVRPADDQGRHELVGGERRVRAIRMLIESGDWPDARTIDCRLFDAGAVETRLAALDENLQRRNLNPIEEAQAYRDLRDLGLETSEISDRVSMTQRHIQYRLALLDLPQDAQDRMTLPGDDPKRLSVSDARKMVQTMETRRKAREKLDAELTPRQRLILAELFRATGFYVYGQAEVQGAAMTLDEDAIALEKAGLILIPTGRHKTDGRSYATLDAGARSALDTLFPQGNGADAFALEMRAELELPSPDDDAYSTPWLNGPFEVPADVQAEIDAATAEREALVADNIARREAQDAERATLAQRGRVAAEQAAAFVAEARAAGTVSPEAFVAVAETAEAPLPWRVTANGGVQAADGAMIIHGANAAVPDRGLARMRLLVTAANAAAGLPTPDEEQPEPEQAIDGSDPDATDEDDDDEGEGD